MASAVYCTKGHYVRAKNHVMGRGISAVRGMVKRETRERHNPSHAFCDLCGSQTIDACQSCQTPIPLQQGPDPCYCGGCSKAFPWTEAALSAATSLANEMEELDDGEKSLLRISLPDLLVVTPNTELAIFRFKKLIEKVSPFGREAMLKIVGEVAAAAVKKQLGL